eukprot:scaffold370813_cov18-Prasinocladus_malaysianus.AAC.1
MMPNALLDPGASRQGSSLDREDMAPGLHHMFMLRSRSPKYGHSAHIDRACLSLTAMYHMQASQRLQWLHISAECAAGNGSADRHIT